MSAAVVFEPNGKFELPNTHRRLIAYTIYVGLVALAFGVTNGLAQALNYAHIDIFKYYPGMRTYYQGLTAHGVFNAIIFTFAFANGFVSLALSRALNRPLSTALLHAAFWSLAVGTVLTAGSIFSGKSSVLYTFYAPLQAHWTFYLGLALVVISTWITSVNLFVSLHRWRKEHPGERVPLMAFMAVVTYIFWDISSLGVGTEDVFLLLPWSLGLLPGAAPMLSRTLFWYTGHPIVYYWLLPVYISWYTMIPRQVGGALFSDAIARIAFLLFLCILPVGMHHQYVDPELSHGIKFVTAVLTFALFMPSLLTAFSVMYALEIGGRRAGGRGLLGWFFKLPWSDPSVTAQILAMLTFLPGGITGLMNASYNMNLEIHNTSFVPGHFHLTVGSAVALSIMGICYWLVPFLEGKRLWGRKLAIAQAYFYFVGVLIFARGLISGGLAGMPRRTAISLIPYAEPAGWRLAGILTGIGGALMFIGGALFFVVMAMTVLFGEKQTVADIPFAETIEEPLREGWQPSLDRLAYWTALSLLLVVVMYGPFLATHLPPKFVAQPFQAF